jgi:hypothetical protein
MHDESTPPEAAKAGAMLAAASAPAGPASGVYQEKEHNGRLYVFETEKAFQAAQDAPNFAYSKTFIGAGPGGKTVVVEADSKDLALQNRLIAESSRRHKYR